MRIGIIGSGNAGQTLGSALVNRGHEVKLGSRTPEKLEKWLNQMNDSRAGAGTFGEAAEFGEIVFNAVSGAGSLEALQAAVD